MTKSKTHAKIAIRIPSWLGYGREIYRGIGNYMAEKKLRWDVESEIRTDGELKPIRIDDHWLGDGAIFFRYSDAEAATFKKRNCPLISISRESQAPWVPRVHPDNHMIGQIAAEHLIGTGCSHLACWVDPNRSYSNERREGFLEVANRYRRHVTLLENPISQLPSDSKWSEIRAVMLDQIKKLPTPTAMFARDDIAATGLIRAAAALNLKVPEDLAVLGVGNDPILNSITMPTMSSVAIPAKLIGWQAARLLHERLENKIPAHEQEAEVISIPVKEVIRRETTNYLHVQDDMVTEACHLIKTSVGGKLITVQQICVNMGISSTTLLKRFKTNLDMSPKQFIDRTRYEEAVRLLNQTSWPVKEVAYEIGFRSPEEFDRFFKRHSGMSPGSFRHGD